MSVDISSTSGRHVGEVRIEPHTLRTGHGDVQVLDVFPSAVRYYRGQVMTDDRLVFSHGWGERVGSTISFAERLALEGMAVTLFDYPSVRDGRATPGRVQAFRNEVFHNVLDSVPGQKSVVAHSEGTYQALDAAANRNDIAKAMLAAPAGLSGTYRPGELVRCAANEAKTAIHGTRTNVLGALALVRAGYGLMRSVVDNPKLSWAEVLSIASTDARPDLERAIERDVRLGIVACRFDQLFPAERIEAHLDGLENKIKSYEVLEMNHFHFLVNPVSAGRVVEATRNLFELAS